MCVYTTYIKSIVYENEEEEGDGDDDDDDDDVPQNNINLI